MQSGQGWSHCRQNFVCHPTWKYAFHRAAFLSTIPVFTVAAAGSWFELNTVGSKNFRLDRQLNSSSAKTGFAVPCWHIQPTSSSLIIVSAYAEGRDIASFRKTHDSV